MIITSMKISRVTFHLGKRWGRNLWRYQFRGHGKVILVELRIQEKGVILAHKI